MINMNVKTKIDLEQKEKETLVEILRNRFKELTKKYPLYKNEEADLIRHEIQLLSMESDILEFQECLRKINRFLGV